MIVEFPANCTSEGSRWSFTTKLNEVLRLQHNSECAGMAAGEAEAWRNANHYTQFRAVMKGRNDAIAIAKLGAHWNPKIPDHVQNGVINYPPGLNQSNEGSRGSFLFGLMHKLEAINKDDEDYAVVTNAITQAKQDAIANGYWNPTLEDIVDA